MKKSVGIALMTSLLAACGGGSSSVPAVQTPSAPTSLALTLHVPGANNAQALRLKHPLYTSRDTKGLGFEYKSYVSAGDTPFSGAPASTGAALNFGSSIAPGQNGCGSAGSDGSFTCTIYIPAIAAGYYDFRVTLWNAAPTGCSALGAGCTFSGNELSTVALQNYAVKTGQSTTYSFTLLPVVDNVAVSLSGGIVDGTPSSVTGYVVAKDAMGNIILGSDHFVDSSLNQITIAPVINSNLSGSLSIGGSPSFTTGGSGNTFTLNYDGTQQFPSAGASQPSIGVSVTGGNAYLAAQTPAASLAVTQSGGSLNVGAAPQIASVASLGVNPQSLMVDAQNDVIVSNGTLSGGINCVAGPCAAGSGWHGSGANLDFATLGTDNDVWTISNTQNKLVAFQPANLTAVDNIVTETTPFTAGGFVFGQDNQIYVSKPANPGGIYYFDTAGTQHGPITSNIAPLGGISKMIVGPTVDGTGDPSVCFIEPGTKQLGCLDITTLGATPPSVIVTTLAKTPSSLTLGPNGYIYVGETGEIQAFDFSSGSLSQATNSPFNLANSAHNVTGITVGNDGNVWFVEDAPIVGRLAIQSSVVKTIDEWTSAVTGLSGSATPNGIVASRSGTTLYLTDSGNNEVWSITP